MMSIPDLLEIVRHAADRGAKVIIAGDHEQLAAVESGGGMTLLARRLGYVQLAEAVRFTARWEQDASLRLRTGDTSALDEYQERGRIRGADPDKAMDDAVRRYVAHYLADRDTLLMIHDRARCREASRRIRDDLIHLGLVDDRVEVALADGARASAGDLIICRQNDHSSGGRGAGQDAGQRGPAADRVDPRRRRAAGPPRAGLRPGDRGPPVDRPRLRLLRLRNRGPRLRRHGSLGSGPLGAGRHPGGHRDRGPAVAVRGDDAGSRGEHDDRVHACRSSRRRGSRHQAGARAGTP